MGDVIRYNKMLIVAYNHSSNANMLIFNGPLFTIFYILV